MRTVTLELPDELASRVEHMSVAELSRIIEADRAAKVAAFRESMDRLRDMSPPMTEEEADRFFEESYAHTR